jgi:hypothetical protein
MATEINVRPLFYKDKSFALCFSGGVFNDAVSMGFTSWVRGMSGEQFIVK